MRRCKKLLRLRLEQLTIKMLPISSLTLSIKELQFRTRTDKSKSRLHLKLNHAIQLKDIRANESFHLLGMAQFSSSSSILRIRLETMKIQTNKMLTISALKCNLGDILVLILLARKLILCQRTVYLRPLLSLTKP